MDEKEAIFNNGRVSTEPKENGDVVFYLRGELDHHSVKDIREEIDKRLIDYRPESVIFDLEAVTFTDSAGLGLILGRYTRISGYGGKIKLIGVSDEFFKILRLAGTDKFMQIERKNKDGKSK